MKHIKNQIQSVYLQLNAVTEEKYPDKQICSLNRKKLFDKRCQKIVIVGVLTLLLPRVLKFTTDTQVSHHSLVREIRKYQMHPSKFYKK